MPMLPIFQGCLAFVLPVTWQAELGMTYTLQQSTDMATWDSIPAVIPGSGMREEVALAFPGSVGFARIRYSSDGDTNENGLPDEWECSQLGVLDVDPSADPDGDGFSNLDEWHQYSDPADFFNGEVPVLRINCGTEWLVPPGTVSSQCLSMYLEHRSGEPWPDAPVSLRLPVDAAGCLVLNGEPQATELLVRTDPLGRIHPGLDVIQYLSPETTGKTEYLSISAGKAQARLLIRTSLPPAGGPPRELTWGTLLDGAVSFEWSGDASGADALIIEEQTGTGEWKQLVRVATSDLPDINPQTNRYALIVE